MTIQIGNPPPSIWASQNASSNSSQQPQTGLKAVMSALQSGDLAGAQKAFAALNIDTSQLNSNSPMSKLSTALQNGDLSGAQKAAKSMVHHRHHMHASGGGGDSDGDNDQSSSSTTSTDTSLLQMIAQSLATTLQPSQNSQIQTNVSNLVQQLSAADGVTSATSATSPAATTTFASTAPPAASAPSSSALSNLQNNLAGLIIALGGQMDSSSMNTFLTTLQQNLQGGSTTGNLLNVSA